MNVKEIWPLIKNTVKEWTEDRAARLAAALAYYAIFALAPLLVIAVAIAGLVFGEAAAQGQITGALEGIVGEQAAETIQTMVQNTWEMGGGTLATIIGVATLLIAASGFFAQLQGALNTIWGVKPKPGRGILKTVQSRALTFAMVLGIGFLLLASLLASTALAAAQAFLGDILPDIGPAWQIANLLVFFAIFTVAFASVYKVLPDVRIEWRDVWVGAAITAVLFIIGNYLISLYLGFASVGSAYGAAGSLVILLVWIYYSAQVFLFGAEFTQVYARRHGAHLEPAEDAVWIGEEGTEGKKGKQSTAEQEQEAESQSDMSEETQEQDREEPVEAAPPERR